MDDEKQQTLVERLKFTILSRENELTISAGDAQKLLDALRAVTEYASAPGSDRSSHRYSNLMRALMALTL